jgi:hypothetical protein
MDKAHPSLPVIMGDLIDSERAMAAPALHAYFNRHIETINKEYQHSLISPLTITLGDEFQGLARSLAEAAAIARQLRLNLMADKIDCRFVIGLVTIQTPINTQRAWNMMGPGLSRAREKLNEKSTSTYYRFSLPSSPLTEVLLEAIGAGMTAIERDWTDRQRNIIALSLNDVRAKDLAKAQAVTVHNIYKIRSAGKFDTYAQQWQAVMAAFEALDGEKEAG